jgi:glycosyltransferase involved in cell wall biosynthesis
LLSEEKILFVSSYLSATNGSLCVSEKLSRQFQQRGIEVKLVSRKRNKIARLLDILFTIVRSKASVVHIDVYSGQAFMIAEAASFLASRLGKRQILTLHGGALPEFYPKHKKRITATFRRADVITTPSRYLMHFFEREGFPVRYIPNSIDADLFVFERSEVKPHSMLWVRAFDPIYNPHIAVQTLARVITQYPDATLTMVGPDKGILAPTKELVRQLGVEKRVHFTGPIRNEDLPRLYQTHEVFLNTPSYESFGVAVLEAASCGIPIVSSNVGEIRYLWEDEKEILVTYSLNADGFAENCARLFRNKQFAANLARSARAKAETFQSKRIESSWFEVLGGNHQIRA